MGGRIQRVYCLSLIHILHLIETLGGWRSRAMIAHYLRLCKTLFLHYKGRVRCWLPFNEINMILHAPFLGAGICFEAGEKKEQVT